MDNDFAMGYAMGSDNNGGNCNGNGMWGDGWMGLIAFALIFGNGWGGFGGFGGGNGGMMAAANGALTRSDLCNEFSFNDLQNGVRNVNDSVNIGFANLNSTICHQQYDTAQLVNGINQNLMQGFHGVDNSVCTLGYQQQAGVNQLSNQIAQCCCDNRQMISDLKYDMATSDCSIKTLVNQLAQQLMWGQQNGLRDLTDLINNKFCQLEMSQKDAIIADLRTQLAQCGDQNMANSIVARLSAVINPPAVPAYPAANPNGCGSWPASFLTCNGGYGNAYNNSCGCNSGCCGCNG